MKWIFLELISERYECSSPDQLAVVVPEARLLCPFWSRGYKGCHSGTAWTSLGRMVESWFQLQKSITHCIYWGGQFTSLVCRKNHTEAKNYDRWIWRHYPRWNFSFTWEWIGNIKYRKYVCTYKNKTQIKRWNKIHSQSINMDWKNIFPKMPLAYFLQNGNESIHFSHNMKFALREYLVSLLF